MIALSTLIKALQDVEHEYGDKGVVIGVAGDEEVIFYHLRFCIHEKEKDNFAFMICSTDKGEAILEDILKNHIN